MATTAAPAALTATRGTPRSTPTASWSWRPPRPRATSVTRRRRRSCWPSWPIRSTAVRRCRRPRRMLPVTLGRASPPFTATALWHRAIAGQPARRQHRPSGQGPSPGRTRRALHQGPVPDRPCRRHRHLPRPAHRPDPRQPQSTPPPPRPGQLRPGRVICPLASRCTSAQAGRTVTITAYEQELAAARTRQADPDRAADTAPPGPRSSASWPIWSAAAMAAAASGSGVLPRSPPTSACWPPRSTWLGWACSACTGPRQMAGPQHEPTGVPTSASRAHDDPHASRRHA